MRSSSIALGIVCGPIVCLYVSFAACFCPGRLRRRGESEEKRRFERRQKMAPRPLPVRPPSRALTIPLPEKLAEGMCDDGDTTRNKRGKTLDQSQSRLMRLPMELREMIYRHVVGDGTMHMVLKEQRLGHLRCEAPAAAECHFGFWGQWMCKEYCWGTFDRSNIWMGKARSHDDGQPPRSRGKGVTDGGIVPFLQTCRQIYSESIKILYSTNTFAFSDLDCLRYFSGTTLPHRFNLIQSLDLEWCMAWPIYDPTAQRLLLNNPVHYPPYDEATWEETWRIMAGMLNLKCLKVNLMYHAGFNDAVCEAKILKPLKSVTRPTRFEVRLSWEGNPVADAPFTLIRPQPLEKREENEVYT